MGGFGVFDFFRRINISGYTRPTDKSRVSLDAQGGDLSIDLNTYIQRAIPKPSGGQYNDILSKLKTLF